MKTYTVLGIYRDNQQRNATTVEADSPAAAAVEANVVASTDNYPQEPVDPNTL